jgi:excinuclease UvrABC nuclease subunit
MKMCLAPCYMGCTDERYAEEAAAVQSFIATRGESRLVTLRTQRDQASANLEFESAAALHAQVQRVESIHALASELVRPLSRLRAVILQPSANPGEVAVFLFENGCLRGPAGFSTIGMRIQNEQSGSTSLFAQPMALEPVPEEQGAREQATPASEPLGTPAGSEGAERQGIGNRDQGTEEQRSREQGSKGAENPAAKTARTILESRLESVVSELSATAAPPSATVRQGHLALLKRWYYRPEARRTGEIFFPDAEDRWRIRAILRGIGRVAAKSLLPSP